MGIAKRHTERGREQAGMSREGRRMMEKVLENTVRDTEFGLRTPSEDCPIVLAALGLSLDCPRTVLGLNSESEF